MIRVAYVSTYLPKRCGLATYTYHLRQSMKALKGWMHLDPVVTIVDTKEQKEMHDPALWPLLKHDREDYRRIAEKINNSNISLVSLQHEFGIFGGNAGEYVLDFVRHLKKPLVTTFHTVFEQPQEPYYSIQKEIAERSEHIIVMNRLAIPSLQKTFSISPDNITFIPHGTPAPDPQKRLDYRKELGWDDKKVIMTFGLLSRGKGIELILQVLPDVVKSVPNVHYAIVGQTHPEVRKTEGEAYREELKAMIRDLHIEPYVTMVDRYLDEQELVKYITACDVYITPYPGMQQVTSGTLAYAVGLGRPVLTTPYSYARDLLKNFESLLIPYDDRERWARKISEMLTDDETFKDWESKMLHVGQTMHWPEVGKQHARLFTRVSEEWHQADGRDRIAFSVR